ncbi:c-type cytochrome [Accumulibacter sp.]|uniref:HVO_0234 family beta-propeller protein n=1 Tax=Accumulibacter sp. TaxID=2053492 RepID=UPI0026387101|nr:c-type cytochrome [Accumulibacter sp.]
MNAFALLAARYLAGFLFVVPLAAVAAPEMGRIFALAPASGSDGVVVANKQGLYLAQPDGRLSLRAKHDGGFTALAADPSDATILYASGSSGGLLRSDDGGSQWQRQSQGGPDSFTALTVSPTDGKRLYGVADGIYQSTDGGRTWTRSGDAPEKLMNISASPSGLYAGTEEGLRFSTDGGSSWRPASMLRIPVTMVSAEPDGTLYSFQFGQGFLKAHEPELAWTPLANSFGGQAIMVMARNGTRLFAATHIGRLFVSADDGRSWQAISGARGPQSAAEKRGEKLFAENCQACHGAVGIGEAPQFGKSLQGLAPALDDTAHAWHHSDQQLQNTILKGSPVPNSRMVAFEGRLSARDAEDVVAYMKSLWNERALRCQGAKHMDPGCMTH